MPRKILKEAVKRLPLKNRENLYGMANSPSAVSKIFLSSVDNFSFLSGRTLVTLCSTGGGIDLIVGNNLFRFDWEDVSDLLKEIRNDGELLTEDEKDEIMEKMKRRFFCKSAEMLIGSEEYKKYEDIFDLYLIGNFHPLRELPDGSHDVKGFLNNLLANYRLKTA